MSKSYSSGLTPSRKTGVDFAEVKRSVDVVAVIEAHGVPLKKEGKDWIGLCPFHADKKPSLRVTPGKGLWRCMSCEAAGNAIQFVARKENVSDHEAALRLLAQLPGVQRASQLEEKKIVSSPAVIVSPSVAADLLNRIAGFYARTLHKDRAGFDYLASRKLADPAMLENFRVGYCNGTLKSALPDTGELLHQLRALGVLNEKGNEVFYGRVVVPILDGGGNVVSLYGRKVEGPGARLPADAARHLYLAGGHKAAFNAAQAKNAGQLIVTEAILDTLSFWQAGYHASVPLYGKSGWTPHHEQLLRDGAVREVVLALDNDEAGRAAALVVQEKIRALGLGCTVRVFAWPEGSKDANAFFSSRENAASEFAALLDAKPTAGEEKTVPVVPPAAEEATRPTHAPTEQGFILTYPNRRYEVLAVEKVSPARLRATVKALGAEPGRFHVEMLDLYSARSRRLFAAEAARLLRLPVETAETDLAQILVAAEQHVAGPQSAAPVGLVSAADRAEALKLGRSADLMAEISRDFKKLGIVGEEKNALLLYLTMTSRKLADPLSAHVISGSGAGKSHLQDAVLTLCPEEDLIKLTSLSSQALFYKGEDSLKHKCLAVEEVAGASGARYAVRNLISAKKLTIETTVKNPLTGKMETQVNTVHGPTAVFETTTDPKTDPETKSRFLVTSIDESPEQTRAILEAQRHRHTLDGMRARHARAEVLRRHHAFQRTLRTVCIVNPYEPLLGYGDDRLVFRRDHPKYLHLILAVTFLHQGQRTVKRDEVCGIEYIETTLSDIAIANDLALELFGTSLDDLSRPGRELLERMAAYVQGKATRTKQPLEKVEFCRRELREAIGWSEYQLRTHLTELVELEYVVPLGGRFGAVFTYRLLGDGSDRRFVPGLKPVEQLRQEAEKIGLTSGDFCAPRGSEMPPRGEKNNLGGTSLNGKHEVEMEGNRFSPAVYVNGAATSGPFAGRVYGGAA